MRLDTLPNQPKESKQSGDNGLDMFTGAGPDQINLGALPSQPESVNVSELWAASEIKGEKIPLAEGEVFGKRVEIATDRLIKNIYGEEKLKEFADSEKKIDFFMSRAPRIGLAFAAPLYALAYEAWDQGTAVIVSQIKGEKYSPLERRAFFELIPDEAPTAIKVVANLGEVVASIALIGGAMNLAKQGTLTQAVKEVGTRLESAGYGSGKVTVTKEAIRRAARGTSLEKAAKAWWKAKTMDIRAATSRQLGAGTSSVQTPITGKSIEIVRPPLALDMPGRIVQDASGKAMVMGADLEHFDDILSMKEPKIVVPEQQRNEMLEDMIFELEGAQLGSRGVGVTEGGETFSLGGKQIFPDWWQEGWVRKNVLNIMKKVMEGKKLTENQQLIYDDLEKEVAWRVEKQQMKRDKAIAEEKAARKEKMLNEIERDKFVPESDISEYRDTISDEKYDGAGDYATRKEYQAKSEGMEGQIVYMSPDEYLDRIKEGFWERHFGGKSEEEVMKYAEKHGLKGSSVEELKTDFLESRIEKSKMAKMEGYDKIYMPHIEYYKEGGMSQEGHHRALYAKELGMKEIPVLIAYPTGKPGIASLKEVTPKVKGTIYTVYQGRGAAREDIYSERFIEVGPSLGEGQYYAFNEREAKRYGDAITKSEINLRNPLLITNDGTFRGIVKKARVQYLKFWDSLDIEQVKADRQKLIDYIKGQGHDGVIIHIEKGFETEALEAYFDHPQIITFGEETQVSSRQFVDTWEKVSPKAPAKESVKEIPATPKKPAAPKKKTVKLPKQAKKYPREPGLSTLITAQNRTSELLGVKKMVEPLERGKMGKDKEEWTTNNEIKRVIKELKKQTKMSTDEMAVLINTNIDAPAGLTEKEKAVFDYFRALTRDILARTNASRLITGREPIADVGAYFRHVEYVNAEGIMRGEIPVPEKLKAWAAENISGKVSNPMEKTRKLQDLLLQHFSKDLEHVMMSMVRVGLKEIYLDGPEKFFLEQLAIAEGIDKELYDQLSPEEQAAYDAEARIPAATRDWVKEYVKVVLLSEKQTWADEWANKWIAPGSNVANIVNKQLDKFGTQLSERAFTDMLVAISKAPLYGVLGGVRPKILIRNKMQRAQDIALYGISAVWKGAMPTSDFPVLEELKSESLFLSTYSGIEELPVDLKGKISQKMMAAFQWSAFSNVNQSMNAAYHWAVENIMNPDLDWAVPERTGDEDPNFFYPSEKELILKEMEFGAQTAQYQYIAMAMPEIFRYKVAAPVTRLQSWWMNHFAVFHREAATRAFTGHVGYTITRTFKGAGANGEDIEIEYSPKVSAKSRLNYLKYLVLGGILLNTLGYGRSFLFGTMPTQLPPTATLMYGMYVYFTTSGDTPYGKNKKREAARMITESAKTFIPGYLMVKDILAITSKEKPMSSYWFYNKIKASTTFVKE